MTAALIAKRAILDALPGTQKSIRLATGYSLTAVHRLLQVLIEEGAVQNMGEGQKDSEYRGRIPMLYCATDKAPQPTERNVGKKCGKAALLLQNYFGGLKHDQAVESDEAGTCCR